MALTIAPPTPPPPPPSFFFIELLFLYLLSLFHSEVSFSSCVPPASHFPVFFFSFLFSSASLCGGFIWLINTSSFWAISPRTWIKPGLSVLEPRWGRRRQASHSIDWSRGNQETARSSGDSVSVCGDEDVSGGETKRIKMFVDYSSSLFYVFICMLFILMVNLIRDSLIYIYERAGVWKLCRLFY